MKYKDYYKILEVSKSATAEEIKKSYRRLARKYHPDVNKDDPQAEKKFKELQEAHEVLGNPENRKLYDQVGSNWKNYKNSGAQPGGAGGGFDWSDFMRQQQAANSGRRQRAYQYQNRGGQDPFGGGSGGFSDFFESIFGGGFENQRSYGGGAYSQQNRQQPTGTGKHKDVNAELDITLAEAYNGSSKTFSFQGERLKITIPPGITDGKKLKLTGKGKRGKSGNAGDMYITIKVKPESTFEQKGLNLYCDVHVDLYTAVLGGTANVPTPTDSVKIKIPAETQSGKTFRLAKLGMPEFRNEEKRGDLYARVMIDIPENLSEKEITLFKELASIRD